MVPFAETVTESVVMTPFVAVTLAATSVHVAVFAEFETEKVSVP